MSTPRRKNAASPTHTDRPVDPLAEVLEILGDPSLTDAPVADLLARVGAGCAIADRAGEVTRDVALAAVAAGATWEQVAAAAGLASGDAARWRWSPSREKRLEGQRQRQCSVAPDKQGVSAAEAARQLGVSRPTLYAWIKSGRVRRFEDGSIDVEGVVRPG